MTIALDSETHLIYPGNQAPTLVCNAWADASGSGVHHHADPELRYHVFTALEKEHCVFHNAPFDLAVYGRKWPEVVPQIFEALDEDRIHDTGMREKLLDLLQGKFRWEEDEDGKVSVRLYSLFDITKRRLDRILDKDTWRLRYHDLYYLPIEEWPKGALEYVTADAEVTLQIFNQQALAPPETLANEAAQVRAHWALHLISCWGIRTDIAAIDRLEARVLEEIETIRDALIEAKLVREDGSRDMKRTVARMLEVCPRENLILTNTAQTMILEGEASVDEILEKAPQVGKWVSVSMDATLASGDTTLQKFSRYSQLQNLLRGSVEHFRTGTVIPIQCRYEPLMETGRTSARGPNMQNPRRAEGVRECFVPRDGCVFVACDYSMAELHTLAQVCLDLFEYSQLAEALNAGVDVHLLLGSDLLHMDYERAVDLLDTDGDVADARQIAKAGNFGFPGGCSAARFCDIAKAWGLELDVRDAARLRNLWFARWPEMRQYFDHINNSVADNGYFWVRQVRVDRIRTRCTYTSACNSYFQGLAADGAKAALYQVAKEQHTEGSDLFGSRTVNFVHDEIIIEVPEHYAHEAAMRLKVVMEQEFNTFVPDVPTTAEPTMMRRWSKKAKQKWKNERLVADVK